MSEDEEVDGWNDAPGDGLEIHAPAPGAAMSPTEPSSTVVVVPIGWCRGTRSPGDVSNVHARALLLFLAECCFFYVAGLPPLRVNGRSVPDVFSTGQVTETVEANGNKYARSEATVETLLTEAGVESALRLTFTVRGVTWAELAAARVRRNGLVLGGPRPTTPVLRSEADWVTHVSRYLGEALEGAPTFQGAYNPEVCLSFESTLAHAKAVNVVEEQCAFENYVGGAPIPPCIAHVRRLHLSPDVYPGRSFAHGPAYGYLCEKIHQNPRFLIEATDAQMEELEARGKAHPLVRAPPSQETTDDVIAQMDYLAELHRLNKHAFDGLEGPALKAARFDKLEKFYKTCVEGCENYKDRSSAVYRGACQAVTSAFSSDFDFDITLGVENLDYSGNVLLTVMESLRNLAGCRDGDMMRYVMLTYVSGLSANTLEMDNGRLGVLFTGPAAIGKSFIHALMKVLIPEYAILDLATITEAALTLMGNINGIMILLDECSPAMFGVCDGKNVEAAIADLIKTIMSKGILVKWCASREGERKIEKNVNCLAVSIMGAGNWGTPANKNGDMRSAALDRFTQVTGEKVHVDSVELAAMLTQIQSSLNDILKERFARMMRLSHSINTLMFMAIRANILPPVDTSVAYFGMGRLIAKAQADELPKIMPRQQTNIVIATRVVCMMRAVFEVMSSKSYKATRPERGFGPTRMLEISERACATVQDFAFAASLFEFTLVPMQAGKLRDSLGKWIPEIRREPLRERVNGVTVMREPMVVLHTSIAALADLIVKKTNSTRNAVMQDLNSLTNESRVVDQTLISLVGEATANDAVSGLVKLLEKLPENNLHGLPRGQGLVVPRGLLEGEFTFKAGGAQWLTNALAGIFSSAYTRPRDLLTMSQLVVDDGVVPGGYGLVRVTANEEVLFVHDACPPRTLTQLLIPDIESEAPDRVFTEDLDVAFLRVYLMRLGSEFAELLLPWGLHAAEVAATPGVRRMHYPEVLVAGRAAAPPRKLTRTDWDRVRECADAADVEFTARPSRRRVRALSEMLAAGESS